MLVKGKTPTGFEYEIDDSIGDDIYIFRKFAKISKAEESPANLYLYDDIMEHILGSEQYDKYCEFQPKTSLLFDDINSIIAEVKVLKNS